MVLSAHKLRSQLAALRKKLQSATTEEEIDRLTAEAERLEIDMLIEANLEADTAAALAARIVAFKLVSPNGKNSVNVATLGEAQAIYRAAQRNAEVFIYVEGQATRKHIDGEQLIQLGFEWRQ